MGDKDDCISAPCFNDGFCKNLPGTKYECVCKSGFEGERCEMNMACLSSPCRNGGACSTTPTGFKCRCLSDFTGVYCEETAFLSAKTIFWLVLAFGLTAIIGGAGFVGKKNVQRAEMHKHRTKNEIRKMKKHNHSKRYGKEKSDLPDYVKQGKKASTNGDILS